MSRVFVVDADPSLRASLETLIRHAGWQPETFETAHALLARPRVAVPNCLVLDVSRPGVTGLDLQTRVAEERPEMPIIFTSRDGDVAMSVQAMKAGAVDFLMKPLNDSAVLGAIGYALDRSRRALDREAVTQTLRGRHASLSRRERQVMALVVAGLLNKQVGVELGISEITVKAHRGRVMRKMHAGSVAHLVKMAADLAPDGARDAQIELRHVTC